ncbi:GBF-interacting protein 1-like isoform X2 [Solanum pennellii]|uniref:GBF-interacting protein 1-like isoform X2 n=1 Tax=Solanum pennellii TaxID=28526 RepID=A0ABM1H639_SOLPN|nr:GBF-interacting protein 1-like isoform X2 [Solanum pennellii]
MSTGVSRVIIPSNVRKTIDDIKEIAAGKHTDEDIYAMLKECNMDPNDTAQKLLYLDTFHEVKRKRDRKKTKGSSQTFDDYRWPMSGMQRRARDGREIISANYITDSKYGASTGDVSGRRYIKKENGVNNSKDRISKVSKPPARKTEDASIHPSKEFAVEVAGDDPGHVSRVTSFVNVNKLAKVSTIPPNLINRHLNLDPGPTPTPTPTFTPGTRFKDKVFISIPHELVKSTTSASVSGVYSSSSDPVLVPALNPRNSGTVGTIKREIGSQRTVTDSTVSPANEGTSDACQDAPQNTNAVTRTVNYINTTGPKESWGVSVTAIQPVVINHESQHSKKDKVLPSQAAAVAKGDNLPSVSKPNSSVEQAVQQLDMKLEKLNVSAPSQPVIFPNNLQVPESFRSGLTFGSLDPQLDQSISCGKDSMPVETVPASDTTSMEPGSYKDASSAAQRGDYPDNLLSHQNGSENISPFEVSGASHVYDPSKLEKCPLSAGSQSPLLQTPPDYSLGFVPPMLGPHLVCLEGPEQQGGNPQAPSTLGSNQPVAQPIGFGQSSVSVPPHLFPLVRQPFPPNYMSYNPYIPHLYMPQSAHQFLGPSGFPQQPSPANFYMSPSVTAAGVKLPLPSLYKPAAIAGNLNHFGIPTGYSSYGSSTVSYSGTPALVCSASNENLAAPDLKEKNVYSMHKQNEDSHYRNSAPGRDQSMLQTNYFYNIPQDQHIAVAPAHSSNSSYPGINASQTLVAQSTVQPLAQQPQTVARSGDSGLPTSGAFQQPQATIHWNNKLLNRENV